MHTKKHIKHYYTYIMMYLFYFSTGEWHYTNSDFGIPGPCQSGTLGLSQSQWDARHSVLQALLNAAPQSMYVCLLSLCVWRAHQILTTFSCIQNIWPNALFYRRTVVWQMLVRLDVGTLKRHFAFFLTRTCRRWSVTLPIVNLGDSLIASNGKACTT